MSKKTQSITIEGMLFRVGDKMKIKSWRVNGIIKEINIPSFSEPEKDSICLRLKLQDGTMFICSAYNVESLRN